MGPDDPAMAVRVVIGGVKACAIKEPAVEVLPVCEAEAATVKRRADVSSATMKRRRAMEAATVKATMPATMATMTPAAMSTAMPAADFNDIS